MSSSSRLLKKKNFLLLSVVGYGLHITLVTLVGWPGSPSIFEASAGSEDLFSPFALSKNIAFCAAFLVWFAFALFGGKRVYGLFSGKVLYLLFSGMVVIGMALTLVAANETSSVWVEYTSGILMGVGVSGNFALWQRTLCELETPLDAQGLIGGTVLGAVLYFIIAWFPVWLIRVLAMVAIAPGTAILLAICNRNVSDLTQFPVEVNERRANLKKGIVSLLMPVITIGAIGFVIQTVRVFISEAALSNTLLNNLFSIALILGSLATAIIFERTRYRINMNIFYTYGAPIIGVMLFLLPVLGEGYAYAFVSGAYALFTIASIMAILASNQVARYYNIPPIAIYSLTFGIIYTARFLPVLLLGIFRSFGLTGFGFIETLFIALLCTELMFGVYVASNRFRTYQSKKEILSWESALPEEPVSSQRPLTEAIRSFALWKGLTEREIEVLLLLHEGRSVPYIATKLMVAENTVKFHCKNIYSKLEVHTRQELLDLLPDESTYSRARNTISPGSRDVDR